MYYKKVLIIGLGRATGKYFALGRKNQEFLINLEEAAKIIIQNCGFYGLLSVDEINIGGKNYEIAE